MMNGLTATAPQPPNLKSFTDKGAEDLLLTKRAWVQMLGSPTMPDGSGAANPFYNEAWSKDYNTLDPLKYERLIPGLQASPGSLWRRIRTAVTCGSSSSTWAPARRSRRRWPPASQGRQRRHHREGERATCCSPGSGTVDGLIESDTRFGDLHTRYLARDLGYDGSTRRKPHDDQ
jgi:hypothetical protein